MTMAGLTSGLVAYSLLQDINVTARFPPSLWHHANCLMETDQKALGSMGHQR